MSFKTFLAEATKKSMIKKSEKIQNIINEILKENDDFLMENADGLQAIEDIGVEEVYDTFVAGFNLAVEAAGREVYAVESTYFHAFFFGSEKEVIKKLEKFLSSYRS